MVSTIIADDNKDICITLSNELNITNDIKVLEIIDDGAKVIPEIKRLKPQMIILDLKMPGRNGLQIIDDIENDDSINTKVVVLSGEQTYITKLRDAKCVSHYLQKGDCFKENGRIIKKVAKEINGKSLDKEIYDYLYDLGYTQTNQGTELIKECIKAFLLRKNYDIKIKELFKFVSEKKSIEYLKVKNNIFKATKVAKDSKEEEYLVYKLKLGKTSEMSPSNVIKMSRYYINAE